MTDGSKTLIGLVVDRSGSMSACKHEMEDGINGFMKKSAKLPGRVKATLAQFDTDYEVVYPPTAIRDVPTYELVPRGGTALLDAMGKFITEIGSGLQRKPESSRPGKVIIVVVTDGYENSSREWTREGAIRELVQQQQNDYGWEFVFLGAGMDAVKEASNFGIATRSAMTYNTANAASTFDSLSSYVAMASAGPAGSASFTEEDREEAVK